MSTEIEKIDSLWDCHDEDGDRSEDGANARTDIIVMFKMNGKEGKIAYTIEYVMTEDGPDESTPEQFEVNQDMEGWLYDMWNLADNIDDEDPATLQAIIDASEGVLTSVDDIKALIEFIDEERPWLSDMGDFM